MRELPTHEAWRCRRTRALLSPESGRRGGSASTARCDARRIVDRAASSTSGVARGRLGGCRTRCREPSAAARMVPRGACDDDLRGRRSRPVARGGLLQRWRRRRTRDASGARTAEQRTSADTEATSASSVPSRPCRDGPPRHRPMAGGGPSSMARGRWAPRQADAEPTLRRWMRPADLADRPETHVDAAHWARASAAVVGRGSLLPAPRLGIDAESAAQLERDEPEPDDESPSLDIVQRLAAGRGAHRDRVAAARSWSRRGAPSEDAPPSRAGRRQELVTDAAAATRSRSPRARLAAASCRPRDVPTTRSRRRLPDEELVTEANCRRRGAGAALPGPAADAAPVEPAAAAAFADSRRQGCRHRGRGRRSRRPHSSPTRQGSSRHEESRPRCRPRSRPKSRPGRWVRTSGFAHAGR